MMSTAYQPKTGARCSCKRGIQRDNCPNCEGTGYVIDFAAIRARKQMTSSTGTEARAREDSIDAHNRINREKRIQQMNQPDWQPEFSSWRHGGWYVGNLCYPSGAVGCVSRNYDDKKWRIVCDPRPFDEQPTFPNRIAAAFGERELINSLIANEANEANEASDTAAGDDELSRLADTLSPCAVCGHGKAHHEPTSDMPDYAPCMFPVSDEYRCSCEDWQAPEQANQAGAGEREWSGSCDPCDPANHWIDDETGERVSATTGERTQHTCPEAGAGEHTPLPWRVSDAEGDKKAYIVADSERYGQSSGVVLIAQIMKHRLGSADRVAPDEIQQANAAFIVRAVNSHAALVEAATRAQSRLSDLPNYLRNNEARTLAKVVNEVLADLQQALALAEREG